MTTIEVYEPLSKVVKNGKYRGCWNNYEDGTRQLITKCGKCFYATDDPFWKDPKDVDFSIKTRSQKAKLKRAKRDDVVKYFAKTVEKTASNMYRVQNNDYEVNVMTTSAY